MDYSQLSDFEINCRVAIALGMKEHFFMNAEGADNFDEEVPLTDRGPIWQTPKYHVVTYRPSNGECFNPCNNAADAWPIIVKNRISIINLDEDEWGARGVADRNSKRAIHENSLRAAMIVFLMMQESQHA
ncbi:phage protein NinX family protein [Cronobacter malonaticus]|uniref:phage protein NinX family protein n=1 Tax=Cronobacter malonaticus TaxID=413503 RepID=UPI00059E07F0|nr:phage protein NinX family protein [Cronobacter malonaticus]